MKGPLHDIVIVGPGLVGALAAAALARTHGRRGGSVTLVPLRGGVPLGDDSLDPFGPAIPGGPGTAAALAALGLDRRSVPGSDGSFSLGTAFTGWAGHEGATFQPYGDTGAPLQGVAFQHLVWRARAAGQSLRMADFALAARAAQVGRFTLSVDDPRSVLSSLDHGVHLHRDTLTTQARQAALLAGARLAPAPLQSVQRAADGRVDALILADGSRLAGTWFIDAGGAAAPLAGADNGWIDGRRWLPCDRALVTPAPLEGPPPPYALHAADPTGWTRHVGLRGQAWQVRLTAGGDGTAFASGHRQRLWDGNVTFLGAAGFLADPVTGTSLSLTLSALSHLLSLYPVDPGEGVEAGEYQRRVMALLDPARDMAIARYSHNGRTGEDFWDRARALPLTDVLSHRLERFRSRGQIPAGTGDLFRPADWINLFDSVGVRAGRCDAVAAALPDGAILAHLDRLHAILARAVGSMPSHAQVLKRVQEGAGA